MTTEPPASDATGPAMLPRQQNYQFAYSMGPALFLQSDFAMAFVGVYPGLVEYLQKAWDQLGQVFPPEHVVGGQLGSSLHRLDERTNMVVITLPNADRAMEVACIGLVFQPDQLHYFVLGRATPAGLPLADLAIWTLRLVRLDGHWPVARLFSATPEALLEEIGKVLEISVTPSSISDGEFNRSFKSVPCFPPMNPARQTYVWVLGAIYQLLSRKYGDTSAIPAGMAMQQYGQNENEWEPLIEEILQSVGFTAITLGEDEST